MVYSAVRPVLVNSAPEAGFCFVSTLIRKTHMNPSNPFPTLRSPDLSENVQGDSGSSGVKQTLKNTTRESVNKLKSAASDTADRVKAQASELAGQQKSEVADRIGGYSSAVHKSAEAFEGEDPNIAWLTHRAADRLADLADYVRNRDFNQLKGDVETLARQHPAAFYGGLFVAGLVVGNLLKASGRAVGAPTRESDGGYPRAENVPMADQPETDPWPEGPRAETVP